MKIAFFYLLILLLLLSLSVSCKDNSTSEEDPYNKVTIGQQIWMTDNLNADKFRNGDIIPETRTIADWKRAGFNQQPAWCYYNNDSINKTKFGKLYNWYAVNDPRGLAPKGWHIPFDAEWTNLANNLGGINIAGGKLKVQEHWIGKAPIPMLPIAADLPDYLEAAVTLMEVLIVWVGTAFGGPPHRMTRLVPGTGTWDLISKVSRVMITIKRTVSLYDVSKTKT